MFIALAALAVIALFFTAAALILFGGYRLRDLLLLGFMASVTLYLSRWDQGFGTTIAGRPFTGFDFYLMLTILLLAPLRLLFAERPPLHIVPAALWLAAYAALSLVSGLLNGGFGGVGAAVQVIVVSLTPLLAVLLWIDLMPRDRATHERLLISFTLLIGVLTPTVFIITSIAPNLFGSLLGWSIVATSGSTGFVRGWSPVGSAIATGMLMVIAYGLAMHQVVGCKRRRFAVVLFLVGIAILFTLSRSVLLMFIVFHIAYFWSAIRRQPIRILGLGIVAALVMTPLLFELTDRYSFDRFTQYQDESTDIRASSAVAAIEASFDKPFLGHGPGLLYEQFRVEGVSGARPGQTRAMYVGDRISALEPHNLYLLLTAEHGVPAAIAFVVGLIVLWRRTRIGRFIENDRDKSMASAFNALWIATLIMFLTYSGPLVNAQSSVLLWFFAALGLHWRAVLAARSPTVMPAAPSRSASGKPHPWAGAVVH